ncbi:MAG: hypothetical protein ACYCX6_04425 [Vulcanimicrobiaceae bacterium]
MTRAALRELIDRLPEQEVDTIAQLIVAYENNDRLTIQELLAPGVEPEPDEIEALREADELDDGSRTALGEMRRELGSSR